MKNGGDALDLGCGKGTDTRYLAEHGWNVTAIDMVPKAVAIAKRTCEDVSLHPEIFLGDVLDIASVVPHLPYQFILDNGCLFSLRLSQQNKVLETITSWCVSPAMMLRFGLFTEESLKGTMPESWKTVWIDAGKPRYRIPGDPVPTWSLWSLE